MCMHKDDIPPETWLRMVKQALRDGHEMTPELRQAVIDWLNPYWAERKASSETEEAAWHEKKD